MNTEQNKLLTKIKKLIRSGKRRFLIRKDRNYLDDLLEIGISVEEAWNQILTLNCNLYFFDSKASYRNDKDTLIFTKQINNIQTYIKLKIELDENNNEEIVLCLSFHKDKGEKRREYEMSNMQLSK